MPWILELRIFTTGEIRKEVKSGKGGAEMRETIVWCSILAVIVFAIQYVLCLKANRKSFKLIPAYIIVALYAFAVLFCLIDKLDGSGGVAIWMIFAFIISIANTVALVSDILAWIVFGKSKNLTRGV